MAIEKRIGVGGGQVEHRPEDCVRCVTRLPCKDNEGWCPGCQDDHEPPWHDSKEEVEDRGSGVG